MLVRLELILKRLFKKYWLVWSIFVSMVVVIVLFIVFFKPVSVKTKIPWVKVERGDFIIDLVESGEISAVEAVFVNAPREGRMDLQIIDLIPEGTIVDEGYFLVQFDTSTLDEDLDAALNNLKQAEVDLKSVDTEQTSHLSELETNLQIVNYSKEAAELKVKLLNYESENNKEDARLNLKKELIRFKETEKKIETQKILDMTERQKVALKLEQAKDNVEEIKRRNNQLTLHAPISGMVIYREIGGYKVSIGDKVQPGQAVISIPDLSRMKMVVQINEIDADKLKVGQEAVIRLDAFEDTIYHGTLTSVASLIEKQQSYLFMRTTSKSPSFEVTILINENDEKLKPGMTAQAKIIIDEINDVLFIPIGAVFELENGSHVVYTRRSFPDPVSIKIGKRNEWCVIIEEGLHKDDEVSLSQPTDKAHPVGWFADMERRKSELAEFLSHINTMNELGITTEPVKKNSTQQDSIIQQER